MDYFFSTIYIFMKHLREIWGIFFQLLKWSYVKLSMWKCHFITSLKLYCQGWVSSTIMIMIMIIIIFLLLLLLAILNLTSQLSTAEGVVYSIDDGKTKFYDLLQLVSQFIDFFHFSTIKYSIFTFRFQVEYYQLNHGCLPVRLLHYLSCSPAPAGGVLQLWCWNYVDGNKHSCVDHKPQTSVWFQEKKRRNRDQSIYADQIEYISFVTFW